LKKNAARVLLFISALSLRSFAVAGEGALSKGHPSPSELPEGLPASWWVKVQENLRREEYRITPASETTNRRLPGGTTVLYEAPNRANGFRTRFTRSGILVTPLDDGTDAWSWGLETVSASPSGPPPALSEDRIEYQREGIREWYRNDAKGLEQGFTISTPPRPECKGFSVDMRLIGTLRPKISDDGQAVDFYSSSNIAAIHLAQLKVTDATERDLPAHFEGFTENGGGLRISIDDSAAVYPITIDPLATSPSWTAVGEASSYYGWSAGTAGDVNNDGYSDAIVGAYGNNSLTGKAYLYFGGPSGLSTVAAWTAVGEAAGNRFGWSASTAGDVNGDGYSDVIVGAYQHNSSTGKAYVYTGGPTGLSATAAWTAVGDAVGGSFGYFVSTAGDVNGDGYSDAIVGAPYDNSSTGKAYVYIGGPAGLSTTAVWTAVGEATNNLYGWSASTAGDTNGDGYGDVIVGAYANNFGAGKAYVYAGGPAGLSTTAAWTAMGEVYGEFFGDSVSTAGDVDGDGYADVIVGAKKYDSDTGKAYVYAGGPSGPSTTAAWTAAGEGPGDEFGFSVSTAGDVDGDGYGDVIVGAFQYSSMTGKAYVYKGGPSGLSTTAAWTAVGEGGLNGLGESVSTAGDVNGDGYSDVIVGAPYNNSSSGKTFVYSGGPTGLSTSAAATVVGEAPSNSFGVSVSTAGDVDGDGYSDVIVGASTANSTGKAYLFPGGPSGVSTTATWTALGEAAGNYFGNSVSTAGDVNGDGYADVIVGAYTKDSYRGKAYVYVGGPTGLSATAVWTAVGEAPNNYFAVCVSTAGDVNGDGYSDVIVSGNGNNSSTGKAYVYLGGPSGLSTSAAWTALGEATGDEFGQSGTTAGDVNGDGYSDVVVGAPYNNSSRGKAYLYAGGPSGLSTTAAWTAVGEMTNSYFGYSISTAGDVNGDGNSDVIVGAFGNNGSAGKSYLYAGRLSGLSITSAWTAVGEGPNNFFGASVSTAGDVNGDGYSDVIVGAFRYNSFTGKAYVYVGGPLGLSNTATWSVVGEVANDYFSLSASTAGDVNADGYSDVIVGAYRNNSNTGKAYFYYGGGGMTMLARQLRSDLSAPVSPLGLAYDNSFRLGLRLRTPYGRGRARLEWQVVPLTSNFNPVDNPIQFGPWANTGANGLNWMQPVSPVWPSGPWKWRARVRYRAATSPFQPFGPWFSPTGNAASETDLRGTSATPPPACDPPDERIWIYSVVKIGTDYTLNFQDPNQPIQRTGYHVRRNNDPVPPKQTWPIVATNIVDMDAGASNIQWTDFSNDDPGGGGIWYYEVTAYNSNCPNDSAEGPF